MVETTDMQALSSAQARLLVLELSVAALIAQLPPQSLEEVTCLLCFVANSTEQAEDLALSESGEASLGHVGHWVDEMLQRVMNSRKASRVDTEADPPPEVTELT
ncbi:MAG: hypothetical protein H7Z10_12885 [Gemmatimonadaceae bacterium]|nr:hypothetical protein [Acetobacteraceae bacterium]